MTTLKAPPCRSFLVYVCFEEETPNSSDIAKLFNIDLVNPIDVIVVNTKKNAKIGKKIISHFAANRFFEFSGYQLGLKKILHEKTFTNARILLVNSTIFKKPSLRSFYLRLFNVATRSTFSSPPNGRISGLISHRESYSFIPTCFFEIAGSRTALSEVVFVPAWLERAFFSINQKDFETLDLYVGDKDKYLERQKNWLNPKNILAGWYQAPFFKPLARDVYRRKQVTTYLEHSFLSNNSSFEVVDLRTADRVLTLLEKVNRANIVAWKIKNRLLYLLFQRPSATVERLGVFFGARWRR